MASEKLDWIFTLFDSFSGPAKRITSSMDAAYESQKRFLKGLGWQGAQTRNLQGQFESIWRPMDMVAVGIAGIGAAAAGAAVALGLFGGASYIFGKAVIDQLRYKETTMASLEMILKSKDAAASFFEEAKRMAVATPFEMATVIDSYKQFLSAGFTTQEVPLLFQAFGDVSAGKGDFTGQTMGLITNQIAQMKGRGKMLMEDAKPIIMQMSSGIGVGFQQVYAQIGKQLGVAAEKVPEMVSAGLVTADVGIMGMLAAIQERTGGRVGSLMLEQSKTITGLFSIIGSIWQETVLGIGTADISSLPGVKAFKGFLTNIIKLFDATTATGARFRSFIETTFNRLFVAIFGPWSDEGGLEGMQRVLDSMMVTIGGWVDVAIGFFGSLNQKVRGLLDEVVGVMRSHGLGIGNELGLGIFEGLKTAMLGERTGGIRNFWFRIMDSQFGTVSWDEYNTRQKAMRATDNPVEKANIERYGIERARELSTEGRQFSEAFGGNTKAFDPSTKVPSAQTNNINLTVQVDGTGKDAEQVGAAVGKGVLGQLGSLFETLGAQSGAA